jgi:hypothetical protein
LGCGGRPAERLHDLIEHDAKPYEPGVADPSGLDMLRGHDDDTAGGELSDAAFDASINVLAAMPLASYEA